MAFDGASDTVNRLYKRSVCNKIVKEIDTMNNILACATLRHSFDQRRTRVRAEKLFGIFVTSKPKLYKTWMISSRSAQTIGS